MSNLNLAVVISAVDQLTRPLRGVKGSLAATTKVVSQAERRLSDLGKQQGAVDRFVELKNASEHSAGALKHAQDRAAKLARELRNAEEPSDDLRHSFYRATQEAKRLKDSHARNISTLQRARAELRDAGVSTERLAAAQTRLRRDTTDANRALQQHQERLKRIEELAARVERARDRMGKGLQTAANMRFVSQAAGSVARGIANSTLGMLDGVRSLERAKGELATLGVEEIDIIVARGRALQNRIAGITAAGFVTAAYDIRSGIAGLSDEGVAAMTAAAAVTAKATKAGTEQMTSLFATAHGLFKRQFSDLGDGQFGELFAAALSKSVQQFKTTGGKMQRAIESAGAFAVNLGMDMREQLAVLGMMQTSMTSGEAGTALRSFAENAARAQEKLDELALTGDNPIMVRVIDENGMLRQMPDILSDLTDRYGETLDAIEAAEIKEAFGSTEAVKLIQALWGQHDALEANAAALRSASQQGLSFAEQMARIADRNFDSRLALITQRWDSMKTTIGERLVPVIDRLLPKFDAAITAVENWVERNPELATTLGAVAAVIGVIASVVAPLFIGIAALVGSWAVLGFAVAKASAVLALIGPVFVGLKAAIIAIASNAIPALAAGLRVIGAALMANPIGAIVTAIGLAAWAVIEHWEEVSGFFLRIWEPIQPYWQRFIDWLGALFEGAWEGLQTILMWSPVGIITQAWGPLRGFFDDLWGWIERRFGKAVGIITNVVDRVAGAASWVTEKVGGIFGDDEEEDDAPDPELKGRGRQSSASQAVRVGTRLATVAAAGTLALVPPASARTENNVDQKIEIVIHPTPGQDAREIAEQVARVLEERQRGALHD